MTAEGTVGVVSTDDAEMDECIEQAFAKVVNDVPVERRAVSPGRWQRFRELVSPQANGDQDTW